MAWHEDAVDRHLDLFETTCIESNVAYDEGDMDRAERLADECYWHSRMATFLNRL